MASSAATAGGLFGPDDGLTRAQMATILSNVLGLTTTAENPFADVPADAWYTPYILRCKAAGIMAGDGTNAYPDAIITRQEAMTMLCNAFAIAPAENGDLSAFADGKDTADWAVSFVAALVNSGIVGGVGGGRLAPTAPMTRAEVITVIDRTVVQYLVAPGEYKMSQSDGLVLIRTGSVTLTGWTAADILVTPAADGKSVTFNKATVTGSVTVQADDATITKKNSTLPEITLTGNGSQIKEYKPASGGGGSYFPSAPSTPSGPSNLTVTTPKTVAPGTYQDVTIAAAVGDGDVVLNGLTIQGDLNIKGGGSNSIKLVDCTVAGKVIMAKTSGEAPRLHLTNTPIAKVEVQMPAIIEAADTTSAVTAVETKAALEVKGENTAISTITIPAEVEHSVAVTVTAGAVETIEAKSEATVTGAPGTVAEVVAEAPVSVAAEAVEKVEVPVTAPADVAVTVTGSESVEIAVNSSNGVAITSGSATVEVSTKLETAPAVTVNGTAAHAHKWDVGEVTTEPTCEGEGVKTYTCTAEGCDTTPVNKTESIAALGHKYGAWAKLDDTNHQRVCSNDSNHIETAAHGWDNGVQTTAPTCEGDGVKTYTCSVCSGTKTEAVDSTGHKYGDWTRVDAAKHQRVCANDAKHIETQDHTTVVDEAVAATCTETGLTEGSHCSVCNGVIVAQTTVEALDHDFTGKYTYDDEGHWHVCGRDNCEQTDTKAGHTYDTTDCAKEAACTCGYVKAAGKHSWDEGKVTTAPTCEGEGVKTYTCTACSATETEPVAATGHKYGDWTKVDAAKHQRVCANDASHIETQDHTPVVDEAVAATCTETGLTEGSHCSVCNGVIVAQTTVEALDHHFTGKYTYDDESHWHVCGHDDCEQTDTKAGHTYDTTDCAKDAVCGCGYVKPAGKHSWDEGKVTTEPTCEGEGVKTYACTICSATETEAVSAIGHKYGAWTKLDEAKHQRVCANDSTHIETADHGWDDGVITTKPTETATGVRTYTCATCGGTKTETVPATGSTSQTVCAPKGILSMVQTGMSIKIGMDAPEDMSNIDYFKLGFYDSTNKDASLMTGITCPKDHLYFYVTRDKFNTAYTYDKVEITAIANTGYTNAVWTGDVSVMHTEKTPVATYTYQPETSLVTICFDSAAYGFYHIGVWENGTLIENDSAYNFTSDDGLYLYRGATESEVPAIAGETAKIMLTGWNVAELVQVEGDWNLTITTYPETEVTLKEPEAEEPAQTGTVTFTNSNGLVMLNWVTESAPETITDYQNFFIQVSSDGGETWSELGGMAKRYVTAENSTTFLNPDLEAGTYNKVRIICRTYHPTYGDSVWFEADCDVTVGTQPGTATATITPTGEEGYYEIVVTGLTHDRENVGSVEVAIEDENLGAGSSCSTIQGTTDQWTTNDQNIPNGSYRIREYHDIVCDGSTCSFTIYEGTWLKCIEEETPDIWFSENENKTSLYLNWKDAGLASGNYYYISAPISSSSFMNTQTRQNIVSMLAGVTTNRSFGFTLQQGKNNNRTDLYATADNAVNLTVTGSAPSFSIVGQSDGTYNIVTEATGLLLYQVFAPDGGSLAYGSTAKANISCSPYEGCTFALQTCSWTLSEDGQSVSIVLSPVATVDTFTPADMSSVGTVTVSTADELSAALKGGGAVQLVNDITSASSLYISAGPAVTLDLNGHVLDLPELYIMSGKEMIIDGTDAGSGIIKADGYATVNVQAYSKLTINGGQYQKIKSFKSRSITLNNATACADNHTLEFSRDGQIVINGGNFSSTTTEDTTGSQTISMYDVGNVEMTGATASGYYFAIDIDGCVNADISNCTFTGEHDCFRVLTGTATLTNVTATANGDVALLAQDGGHIIVKSGTYKGSHNNIMQMSGAAASSITVEGGTFGFTTNDGSTSKYVAYANDDGASHAFSVKGGTFEGASELHQYNGIPASSSITGGIFSFDPATYVDTTCKVTNNNDGTWTVAPADSET